MNPKDDWFGTITQAPVERDSHIVYKTKKTVINGNKVTVIFFLTV